MKLLGIDFVPLSTPLEEHLKTLAAGFTLFMVTGLLPLGLCVSIYVLFYTKYWALFLVYLFWIWFIDTDVVENGGRGSDWFQNSFLFKYAADYYPINLIIEPGLQLDPKKNYLSCSFPHGYMPMGSVLAFQTNGCNNFERFPFHRTYGVTLKICFYVPIFREVLLALGVSCASAKSIQKILNYPKGGRVVGLFVGGAAEAFYGHSGLYRLKLKDRKGFIKIALSNGATILPVFGFGQTETFKQYCFPEDSLFYKIQLWLKNITGVSFMLVYGRGFLQYNFGLIPLKKPINLVMGNLFQIEKVENPSQEIIDDTHRRFIEHLQGIFEKYKCDYVENPEHAKLEIF